jgi:hypothetical protein
VNLLGGHTSTVRHPSRSIEIVFPARRQKLTSQSIEPPAIDGKALQCGSFLTLYSEESKAQCLSTLVVFETAAFVVHLNSPDDVDRGDHLHATGDLEVGGDLYGSLTEVRILLVPVADRLTA